MERFFLRTQGNAEDMEMSNINEFNRLRQKGYKPKAGDRVVARSSGQAGEIVRINRRNPSSPLIVKWDKSGNRSNENMNSVKPQESDN